MSIFTKIIRGEIPCHKVYEDAHTFAFLDINPISRGHTLLIPKEPAVTIDALSDEAAAALGRAIPRVCRAVVRATGCPGYNLLQNNGAIAGQVVMHAHIHIIPRYDEASPMVAGSGTGLRLAWPARPLDSAAGGELARAIAAALASSERS